MTKFMKGTTGPCSNAEQIRDSACRAGWLTAHSSTHTGDGCGKPVSRSKRSSLLIVGALILSSAPLSAHAQDGSDATHFWGTSSNSSTSPVASSLMHLNNGLAAGQVNAALDGFLYEGSSISVLSIGSQTVVSTTVIGDDNDVNINADQTANNSGDVSNDGTVEVVTNEGAN